MLKALHIKGVVFSGKGEGARFIKLPWVERQIKEKLGFTPHPGTLNLKLTEENLKNRTLLENVDAIEVSPAKGFNRGRLFKADLTDDLKCAVVIPQILDYPKDVIEIVAPTDLRKKLKVEDGDSVEVKILIG